MTKIKITTTQNIEIDYELATIFDRILAWLIDTVILVAYVGIAMIVVAAAMRELSMGASSIIIVPALLYHLVMEMIFQGQSVGKMALRIRVVRVDGSPPNFGNYVLRWIFRLLETNVAFFYGTAAVGAIAFSPRGQRFGDMMAGTTVIRLGRKVSLADTSFGGTAREGYQPMFPEAHRLDDEDARTIREVLLHHRTLQSQGVLTSCANRVCHVLGVTPPQGMGAEQFLRMVLRDYTHTHA